MHWMENITFPRLYSSPNRVHGGCMMAWLFEKQQLDLLLVYKNQAVENISYKKTNRKNHKQKSPHITKTKKKLCTSNAALLTSFSSECKRCFKDKQWLCSLSKSG